jgi:putative ABC transport system permease protein
MRLDLLWSDLRLAWRNACRRPAFTLLVVATLAAGLGGAAAVFAIVDAVLLRPLPYREPGRLVYLWQTLPRHDVFALEPAPADYTDWQQLRSFSSLALISTDSYTITGVPEAERVHGARVTASLMPLLGISPRLGRAFVPAEDADASNATAILGDGLWRRRYGADPGIVGRTITVDGVPRTVVGVMPPGAQLPGAAPDASELWLPVRFSPAERDNAISHNYRIVGRLAPGISVAQASGELAARAAQQAATQPESHAGLGARVESIAAASTARIRPALAVLAGGVILLLLVAAANVATLLIVRAVTRRRDAAIRTALGASPMRLLTLSMTETLLLAAAGALSGLVLARWMLQLFLPLFAEALPRAADARVGGDVAAATFGAAVALGLVLAAVVARLAPAHRVSEALAAGTRSTPSRGVARARGALVALQIALAVVLLTSAALMLQSLVRLARVKPGFDGARVLTFRMSLPDTSYRGAPARAVFADRLLTALRAVPGIERAALTSQIPLGGSRGANGIEIEGRPAQPGEPRIADQRHVTADYFQTMGIPLREGRLFTAADDERSEPVALVNRTMAKQFFPGVDPIGHRVRVSAGFDAGQWFRIVGIVGDVNHVSLSRAPVPELYRPYAQAPVPDFVVAVKTAGAPAGAAAACRAAIGAVDRNLPLYDVRPMAERVARSYADARATGALLAATALIATLLAAVAIYGAIWYSVAERVFEIGIRMALGATRASVCSRIVGGAVTLGAIGIAAGVPAALAAGRLLNGMLFNTSPVDPATYAGIAGGVLILAIVASLVPARRAMRVDPLIAIRADG